MFFDDDDDDNDDDDDDDDDGNDSFVFVLFFSLAEGTFKSSCWETADQILRDKRWQGAGDR